MKKLFFLSGLLFVVFAFQSCKKESSIVTDKDTIINLLRNEKFFVKTTTEGDMYQVGDKFIILSDGRTKGIINYNKKLYGTVSPSGSLEDVESKDAGNQCAVVTIDGEPTIVVPVNQ